MVKGKKLHSLSIKKKRDRPTGEVSYRGGRVVARTKKETGTIHVLSKRKRPLSGDTVHLAAFKGGKYTKKSTGLTGTLKYVKRKDAGEFGSYGWTVTDHRVKKKSRK